MKACKWISVVAIVAVYSVANAAGPNDLIVSHYEPLQRLSIVSVGNSSAAVSQKVQRAAPLELSFDALGRAFSLQLELNDRLLSEVPQSALLAGVDVYRGQLADRSDSWARIVIYDGMPRGLIWDGEEMFAIEAPGDSAVQSSSPVIYRLADALIAPGSMSCGSAAFSSNAATAVASLLGELGTVMQGPGAISEIEMGAIGDFEFTNAKGGDAAAAAAITTRLNNVDGIFSQQVGVQISVQTIETFSSSADPFTESDAVLLLDELSNYRSATPAQNANGLTHLYTGRNLDTTTVGIAWSGALCNNFFGAGLSEGNSGATFDSLIAAHEIGHNFGAPHDGQSGSACESETGAFLMSPSLNGSDQFSSCSIAEMADNIAAASCITALPAVDMEIALAGQSTVLLGANTVLSYDVTNNGIVDATNVTADFTLPGNLSLGSVTASAGTCSSGAGTVSCSFGDVPGLANRTVDIATTPTSVGVGTLTATVSADVDERPGNNTEALQLTVAPAVDLVVNAPTSTAIMLNESTMVNAVLENRAVLDATGVTLSVSLSSGLQANSASWPLGTCTVTVQRVDCQTSNFAAQSSTTVSINVTGVSAGNKNVSLSLASAEADADPANNSISGSVRVTAPKDEEGGGSPGPVFLWILLLASALARRRP